MDRLQTLIGIVLAAASCNDKPSGPPPAPRVDAVKIAPGRKAAAADICDSRFAADSAPAFTLPPLATPAPAAAKGWRWVNLWATWCKPCVNELPMLQRWRDRLAADGHPVTLDLVSVDADDAAITEFRQAHPDTPASARVTDPGGLGPWLGTIGLDEGAPIPVHVLVDPSGRIRCSRAGPLAETDYAAVSAILAAP